MEAKLAAWAAQNQKVDKSANVPVEEPKDNVQPTEESSKPEAQETPKEQPKEETKPTEEPSKEPQQEVVTSWDADETPTKVEAPKVDWTKIGSALELQEVKSEDDIVAKVSELKTKLKEYEEKPLAGIPEEFKEVLEVSKSGVDWKAYLADQLVDYTKLDSDQLIQLFEDDYYARATKNPKFFTDGKFDPNKVDEALDAMPEATREALGLQMAQAKAALQRQRQLEIKAKAEARVIQAEKTLSTATKNLNELLPFESFGIKFEPKHSSEIYQGITNSRLTKKHLGVDYDTLVRSGADMKAISATIAKAEYTEKMLKYKSQTAKVEAKKEILDKIQNPQIKTSGSNVQPESETKKELTAAEKLAFHLKNVKKGL